MSLRRLRGQLRRTCVYLGCWIMHLYEMIR